MSTAREGTIGAQGNNTRLRSCSAAGKHSHALRGIDSRPARHPKVSICNDEYVRTVLTVEVDANDGECA